MGGRCGSGSILLLRVMSNFLDLIVVLNELSFKRVPQNCLIMSGGWLRKSHVWMWGISLGAIF